MSSMIAHCSEGSSDTPSASATAHASDTAFSSRGRHSLSERSSPTVRPEAEVAAASAAMRASLCHSTRFSLWPTRTSMRPRRRRSATCSTSLRGRLSEARVTTGDIVPSTICTRPARYAWKCEMLAAATRPSKRARRTSMCSSPFRSGTTAPSAIAAGSTRAIASSSAGAFTVTRSRPTGLVRRSTTSTRALSVPSGDSTTSPASAISPTESGRAMQTTGTPAFARRTAREPPTAPGPRTATVSFMPWRDRPRGSRPSDRNTRPAPRSLPPASPFRSP